MRIALATLYDARDVRRGSGWPYYLTRELERQGHFIHYIGPLSISFPLPTRILRKFAHMMGNRYRSYQDPFVARVIGTEVRHRLKKLYYDILLTNDYCIAGYTRTLKPIVLYTDAIFPHDYKKNWHPWLANLAWFSVRFCQRVVHRGLRNAALCIFPAHFVMEEAVKYDQAVRAKAKVIPWGANIEDPGAHFAKERAFNKVRRKRVIEVLFIGKDWERKKPDIAIQTVDELNKRGIRSMLHLVGVEPPYSTNPEKVRVYGLLDKSQEEDRRLLHKLFAQSDVLLVPSIAEGYGLVYVEAAAYGLPSLGYKTSGVTTAVKDGESGVLLDLGADAKDFADVIASWFERPAHYDKLVRGARKHYEETANWSVAVKRLTELIQTVLHVPR